MSSVSASKSKQGRVKNRYAQSAPANIRAASDIAEYRERGEYVSLSEAGWPCCGRCISVELPSMTKPNSVAAV